MIVNRRWVLGTGVALAWPHRAPAQTAGKTYRLGWLAGSLRSESYNLAFVQRLAELGFVEGRNLVLEFRSVEGQPDRFPALAAELAKLKCDAVFVPGSERGLKTFKQASNDATPIIIVANDYDPLLAGHVASLARPGGRITGVSMLQTELTAKRLQVLKELLPKVRRVGVLADQDNIAQLTVTRATAAQLGLELVVHQFAAAPYDYAAAFATFTAGKAEALLALGSSFFVPARKLIPELALRHKLPSLFQNGLWADSGGLMSYGPNFSASYRRAAEQTAKVLGGAKPADLPLEQSSEIEMVINLKTAKALGVTVPQALRLRADRMID